MTSITYNTGGQSIFGVPKYCDALVRVADRKLIAVNYCQELQYLGKPGAVFTNADGQVFHSPFSIKNHQYLGIQVYSP